MPGGNPWLAPQLPGGCGPNPGKPGIVVEVDAGKPGIDAGKPGIDTEVPGTVTSKPDARAEVAAAADATGPVAANATAAPPTATARPSARLM